VTERSRKEELADLTARFADGADSAQMLRQVEAGDAIMAGWPGVEPHPEVLAAIKETARAGLLRRRRLSRLAALGRFAAVAAVVAVAVALFVLSVYDRPAESPYADEVGVTPLDGELAEVMADLDEVMASMLEVRLQDYSEEEDTLFRELDMEMEAVARGDEFRSEG